MLTEPTDAMENSKRQEGQKCLHHSRKQHENNLVIKGPHQSMELKIRNISIAWRMKKNSDNNNKTAIQHKKHQFSHTHKKKVNLKGKYLLK